MLNHFHFLLYLSETTLYFNYVLQHLFAKISGLFNFFFNSFLAFKCIQDFGIESTNRFQSIFKGYLQMFQLVLLRRVELLDNLFCLARKFLGVDMMPLA